MLFLTMSTAYGATTVNDVFFFNPITGSTTEVVIIKDPSSYHLDEIKQTPKTCMSQQLIQALRWTMESQFV